MEDYRQEYLEALDEVRKKQELDWAVLMVTDVIRENSLLFTTDFRAGNHLPYSLITDRVFDMPGVMSRKKQLLPEILHAVGE
jgi:manganese-dependent inorganic pyrophosphatase